ncbi:MAG: DNA repair protein RecO [Chitinophagaceae bacterium]
MQLQTTKALVLKTVKYGETSAIVKMLTLKYGLQTFILKGVYATGKRKSQKAVYLQPAALLDITFSYNPNKQLQYLQQLVFTCVYQRIYSNVAVHSIVLFMVEVLSQVLQQPEPNEELFEWLESFLLDLDRNETKKTAIIPLVFLLQLAIQLGIGLHVADDLLDNQAIYFNIKDGQIANKLPEHPVWISGEAVYLIIACMDYASKNGIATKATRNTALDAMLQFYSVHVPEFKPLKTLPILQQLFD